MPHRPGPQRRRKQRRAQGWFFSSCSKKYKLSLTIHTRIQGNARVARRPQTNPRKTASQNRSRLTVDALVEATARVLIKEGYDRASTNKIAAVAGVSIGSLYQYF